MGTEVGREGMVGGKKCDKEGERYMWRIRLIAPFFRKNEFNSSIPSATAG